VPEQPITKKPDTGISCSQSAAFPIFVCMDSSYLLLRQSIEKHVALTDAQFESIKEYATLRKYKKGQFIVHEGAITRKTCFIINGAALALFTDNRGSEHIIQFAIEGWWISDIHSYALGQPALFNVRTIQDCEVLTFTYEDLKKLYQNNNPIQTYFLTITQNAFASFQERVLFNLSLSAEERYIRFINKYPKIELRFPQKVIASYLGISPEFYSKIKKRIAGSGKVV
jgi:CRP-like cAMP-binding protein